LSYKLGLLRLGTVALPERFCRRQKQEKAMTALRFLLSLVSAASALVLPVAAHSQALVSAEAPITLKNPYGAGRASLGLNLSRSPSAYPCGTTALFCDSGDRTDRLSANAMIGKFWGVQMGYQDTDRGPLRGPGESRTQGFNLSLVGKTPVWQSLRVYGKVGTTYGRSDTSVHGAGAQASAEQGFGLSYGAGVSFSFTPRLSATLEWDSNDYRLPGAGREPVRSTSLGLQYRY
jgi:OmpA-OmpF porin, OOP family